MIDSKTRSTPAKKPALKAVQESWAQSAPKVPLHVASAFKALHAGTADEYQQQQALQWLVREACGKARFAYHDNERDTVFALGRQFVGELVVGLFNADLSSLRRDLHVEADSRSS